MGWADDYQKKREQRESEERHRTEWRNIKIEGLELGWLGFWLAVGAVLTAAVLKGTLVIK